MKQRILLLFLLCSWTLGRGQKVLTGIVKESGSGEPVIGASIRLAGDASVGTATDLDGKFTLETGNETKVIVSYVGFQEQTVDISGKTFVEVLLEQDAFQLESVVVTALGITRQEKTIGYAVQEVSGAVLSNNSDPNFLNKLSGQVAGLNISPSGTGPGGTSRILIRGSSSLTGNDEPIFVIDGVIVNNSGGNGATQDGGLDFGNAISNLNPDDIASITVLKGPAAAALYGAQGQNGAIIITTKKGRSDKGLSVSFSTSGVVEQPFIFPDFQNTFGRGSQGTYTPFNTLSFGPRYDGKPVTDWLGRETPYQAASGQMEDFFQNGFSTTNNLEISGGNELSQTRLAASHYYYSSIMPNSDITRTSITLRNTTKLSKSINMDAKLNYSGQGAFNRPNLGGSPDNPVRSFYIMPRSVVLGDLVSYIDQAGLPILWDGRTAGSFNQNPYWAINLNTNEDIRSRLLSSVVFNVELLPWLKAVVRGGVDYINDIRESRVYTNTAYKTSPVANFRYSLANRFIGNYDFLLTANKTFGKFSTTLSAGGSRLDNKFEGIESSGDDQVNPGLWVVNNFKEIQTAQGLSHKRINSLYQFADIGWKNQVYLSFTTRNDWSSALSPQNWSFFYYSSNLSWVLSDTWRNLPLGIDFAKIRASFARVGNDTNLGASSRYFTYGNTVGHLGQPFIRVPAVGPNPDIRPEQTDAFEAGLDLRFLNGKVKFDLSWYLNNTKDQIFRAPVAATSGFQSLLVNAGNVKNTGVELQANAVVLENKNFSWNITLNGSTNRPLVESLSPQLSILVLGGTRSGISVQGRVGGRNDYLVGTRFLKNASGQLILDDFGLPQIEIDSFGNTDFILGHVQPAWMLGMSQQIKYKNLSLSFTLDAQIGGSIYSSSYASGSSSGTLANTLPGRDGWYKSESERIALGYTPAQWIPTNGLLVEGVDKNGEPKKNFINPQQYWARMAAINESAVFDASFVRVNEVALSYNFPMQKPKSGNARSIAVSVFGSNLGFLYRKTPGFAPQSSFSSGKSQGIELFAFPIARSVGAKINVQF
ncbi:MAG: SusC/RagA family TonB-linked outer membrane protein [Saprospiraceae bacterium]